MGDSLRREFSMSPVDTGRMTPPVPIPGMTPTQGGAPQSPALGTEQLGLPRRHLLSAKGPDPHIAEPCRDPLDPIDVLAER